MTTVLVTGASGFVGSHVVLELLREGYTVQGTVQSHNVARVNKGYESFGDRFAAVVIDDLITSDLLAAVKGVDAIIHVASPLSISATPDIILETAVTGTTRILDAALAAGVKKLVVTESIVSLATPNDYWKDITITENCECTKNGGGRLVSGSEGMADLLHGSTAYSRLTREDALKPGVTGFDVYSISKSLSDLTVRNFKRDHPDFDITTIHPSYIYGPFGPGQVYDTPATGTNRHIYALVAGTPGRPVNGYDPATRAPPLNVDVRDVARAHVLALKLPPSESLGRFILSTSRFTWEDAVELLAEKRPELRERLPVITGNETPVGPFATLDTSKTESVLGMRNYIKWQDTVLATVDDLLRVEKELARAT
ncbi:NAD-P-binding protein [Lactarius sanguifluus]|nr:NAD-P-binding protein [Lactarius sanguifluus]